MSNFLPAIWGHIYAAGVRPSAQAWDRFWFTPTKPHTLALIRILGGGMLFYTHLVWTIGLSDFLGPKSWITPQTAFKLGEAFDGRNYTFSYLSFAESSPTLL